MTLVVEDDEALKRSIVRNLVARGYPTGAAGTVKDARKVLSNQTVGLVLLDIDLPDGAGWDVLRELDSAKARPQVIVISGLKPNERVFRELQCKAFLEKPFPMETLLRLVESTVGKPTRGQTNS